MSDWLKRAIQVLVILLGVLGEIYEIVTRPIEREIQDLRRQVEDLKTPLIKR